MIKLLKDSRDLIYAKHYGQTTIFPTEYNVDSHTPDTLQPPGDVKCTAITTCDIAVDQTGTVFDYVELFLRIPSDENGADPRDALKEAVKNGLKRLDNGEVNKKWKSFYRADEGGMDYFDNVRSSIFFAQSPIAFATPWYAEWMNKSILTKGENLTNYHMYSVEGWTTIDNIPYLIVEAWIGRKLYMPREVCNAVLSVWGSQAWVLATDEIDSKRTKSILQKIIDLLTNFIISFKMPTPQPTPVIPQPEDPKLYTIAKSLIGQHLTLDPSVPKETGCAQCMSYILKEAGYKIPKGGISGTYSLYEWLNKNFHKTDTLEKGNILISVTGTGNDKIRGHVGVVLDDEVIASNNSKTGLLDTHWKYENWKAYYTQVGKLKTVIFKPKVV